MYGLEKQFFLEFLKYLSNRTTIRFFYSFTSKRYAVKWKAFSNHKETIQTVPDPCIWN